MELINNIYRIAAWMLMKYPKIFKNLSDRTFLKTVYRGVFKKKLNLDNPKSFNEKIQWLKIYDRTADYNKLVDKFEVKGYISKILGKQYIIPTLGVWENFEDIDFNSLPEQFVLKCTHDSGGVVICKNKKNFKYDDAKKIINKSLKSNFYYQGREWPYKNVRPRIIAEKYMSETGVEELKDYKFLCFNGEPRLILVCSQRFSKEGLHEDFYDMEWNHLEIKRPKVPFSKEKIEKPINFTKMIDFAKRISRRISFVRVDFYEINDQIFFGEMTFFPASGFLPFEPCKWDNILGEWIQLDKKV